MDRDKTTTPKDSSLDSPKQENNQGRTRAKADIGFQPRLLVF